MNLKREGKRVERLRSRIRFTELSLVKERRAWSDADVEWHDTKQSQEILQHVAQAVQQKVHKRIAKVVSSCLASVFDDPYQFKIEFDRKRGRTQARILFCRDGLQVDPISASGGGMIDVAAFALRVVCLVLHRPRLRPSLFFDEPFKNVSSDYQDNCRMMMERLSKEMKVQIILITHNDALATGSIIRL